MTHEGDRGMCFEDYEADTVITTMGRTIGETELVTYVTLAGFYEEVFLSDVAAKASIYGRRIVPGSLTLALSEGLMVQTGVLHGTGLAFLGIDRMRIPRPVGMGDTIHVVARLKEKRVSARRPDCGVVTTSNQVLNQHDEVVMEFDATRLITRRSSAEA